MLCAALATTLAGCGGGAGTPTPAPPPPAVTYTVSVNVNSVGSGEVFKFALGTQSLSITQGGSAQAFATALTSGSSYTVSQTEGPRSCTLGANRTGTLGANVTVTADCGTPPAKTTLSGQLYGPVGAQTVLQLNGANDLTATVVQSPGTTYPYDGSPFSFSPAQTDGIAYQVTLKTAPAGQTCSVFQGASGTTPVAATVLRVGCEWTFDAVSRSSDNKLVGTYYESSAPVLGGANVPVGKTTEGYGEGRFVAFVSSAALAGSSGKHRQIFVRDRFSGTLYLVSANAAGVEGDGDSFAPAISADGLIVAFESSATNLVAGDTNGLSDVFLWDITSTAAISRVSVGAGGAQANGGSFAPSVSGDGTVVAFSSTASNLAAGVAGTNTVNVFRRDTATGTNTLVSANSAGQGVGGDLAMLSEDGKRLAFYSYALTPAGDNNGLWDIFVYDHTSASTQRVSLTSGGGERNQGTESASRVVAPALSGNGRYVAYATTASNVVAGDSNGLQDVFVVDTQTGAVQRASINGSTQGNADSPIGQGERLSLSYDGTWVAFTTTATNLATNPGTTGVGNVVLMNRVTGQLRAATAQTSGSVGPVSLSRDGSYVAFGASNPLDPRFGSTGLFARFTGVGNAYFWPGN